MKTQRTIKLIFYNTKLNIEKYKHEVINLPRLKYYNKETDKWESIGYGGGSGSGGSDGKSAYDYAKDAGYTGTEEEFAQKLAEDIVVSDPDWEAASDEPGYIRNRTHYSDYQAIRTYYPRDVVLDEYGMGIFDCRGSLQTAVPGELRSITVDGVRYISTVQEINGFPVFGNHSFFGGDDNGQPIGAMINPEDTRQYYLFAFNDGWQSRTISVEIAYLQEIVHQIPEKYVPSVPNPAALTINGLTYDGSEPVTVNTVNSEFVVTVTLDENGDATADKTAQELSDAYEAGHSLVCHLIGPDIPYYLRIPFSYHVGLIFLFAGATNGAVGGYVIVSHMGITGYYYNATITINDETWSGTSAVDFTDAINSMIDTKLGVIENGSY